MVLSIQKQLRLLENKDKSQILTGFFKTGKGQYGEGDKFLGLTVPVVRRVIKNYQAMTHQEIDQLIRSKYHEERLAAVLILVSKYQKGDLNEKNDVYDFYLSHTKFINNWDLVDLSAHYIVGAHLFSNKDRQKILKNLAKSMFLWERRIAMISTYYYIRKGEYKLVFDIAEILLFDKHDLIHKAVGWMLREVGKHGGEEVLENFLNRHLSHMPRTSLRYAIERFSESKRKRYLEKHR